MLGPDVQLANTSELQGFDLGSRRFCEDVRDHAARMGVLHHRRESADALGTLARALGRAREVLGCARAGRVALFTYFARMNRRRCRKHHCTGEQQQGRGGFWHGKHAEGGHRVRRYVKRVVEPRVAEAVSATVFEPSTLLLRALGVAMLMLTGWKALGSLGHCHVVYRTGLTSDARPTTNSNLLRVEGAGAVPERTTA